MGMATIYHGNGFRVDMWQSYDGEEVFYEAVFINKAILPVMRMSFEEILKSAEEAIKRKEKKNG